MPWYGSVAQDMVSDSCRNSVFCLQDCDDFNDNSNNNHIATITAFTNVSIGTIIASGTMMLHYYKLLNRLRV